jgi:plastocyanin
MLRRVSSIALTLTGALSGCGEYFAPTETRRVDAGHAGHDVTTDATSQGATFNGCTDDRFVDRTAANASREVTFGATLAYSPPCLLVAAGQTVTFTGAFAAHPLRAGASPTSSLSDPPGNPIANTSTGMTLTVTFPTAGTWPYHCATHFASGMAGVVRVR